MNRLENNLITFMYIFIMYFYINVTLIFKSGKWNFLAIRLFDIHL